MRLTSFTKINCGTEHTILECDDEWPLLREMKAALTPGGTSGGESK